MSSLSFGGRQQLGVRALFLGQRLELRAFEQAGMLADAPLLVSAGAQGCAVLFRYGVVVMFGLSDVEQVAFLNDTAKLVVEAFPQAEAETAQVVLDASAGDGVRGSLIVLSEFSYQRIQLLADILARSVVLGHYEAAVAQSFDRVEPLARSLQERNYSRYPGRELLSHIGDTLSIQSKMVGRVEVRDKAELLWEFPELERLFMRLMDEFEIVERHIALERKLDLITRTAETLLGLLHNRRSLRVEWYIVILILVDIIVSLLEKSG